MDVNGPQPLWLSTENKEHRHQTDPSSGQQFLTFVEEPQETTSMNSATFPE